MYCTLYCVVFCPKTSLINLSSIARFLGCLPVQKWGMGQILDPRRRSRFLHHLSSSSPRSYKASTWSASSEWWPSPSSPFKVVASEQSEWWLSVHDILHFLPHNDPTQVHLSFFWLHTSKPGCQILFSLKILEPWNCAQVRFLWASEETGFRHIYLIVARSVIIVMIPNHLNGGELSSRAHFLHDFDRTSWDLSSS